MRRPAIRPVRRRAPPRRGSTPTPFSAFRHLPFSAAGPEDVAVNAAGRHLCGAADGSILRIDPTTGREEIVGHTGGRPLGPEVTPQGRVIVCDARRGLLELTPTPETCEPGG